MTQIACNSPIKVINYLEIATVENSVVLYLQSIAWLKIFVINLMVTAGSCLTVV